MTCIDCGGSGSLLGAERAGASLARCSICGLVFRQGWSEIFDEDMYDYYADLAGRSEQEVYPDLNHQRLIALLAEFHGRTGGCRLLDVGCGVGSFIRAADEVGWDATGIDLSSSAIEIARSFGLNASSTDLFDPSLDGERFAVIVMSELIEHVPRPSAFLARARDLLSEGGLVYVTTPNWNSLSRRVLGSDWRVIHPEHLSYFSTATLRHCAKKNRMRVECIETRNLSLQAIRSLTGRGTADVSGPDLRADEQQLRASVEASGWKRSARTIANSVLNWTDSGESIRAILRLSG